MSKEVAEHLDVAFNLLTEYLFENTKEKYEEIPEVDNAREEIHEALRVLRRENNE